MGRRFLVYERWLGKMKAVVEGWARSVRILGVRICLKFHRRIAGLGDARGSKGPELLSALVGHPSRERNLSSKVKWVELSVGAWIREDVSGCPGVERQEGTRRI
jgi:hypothetical protein